MFRHCGILFGKTAKSATKMMPNCAITRLSYDDAENDKKFPHRHSSVGESAEYFALKVPYQRNNKKTGLILFECSIQNGFLFTGVGNLHQED